MMLEHPKIKVNPTEVRQEMGHPVRIMHKVRPEDPYLQTSGVRTDGQPPLFVALLHLGETFQEILSISSNTLHTALEAAAGFISITIQNSLRI